jgi:uncharacterized membrane protein YfcA
MLHATIILYFFSLLLIGALAAFFSGMLGIGGGTFYVPGLNELYLRNGILPAISMHLALGTSTCVNVFNAMINISRHRKHQAINWALAKTMMPTMVIGAFAGGYIAGFLPGNLLKFFFALMLLGIGLQYTFKRHHQSTKPIPRKGFMSFAGLMIGLISSLNGLGGGVIMVPFLNRYQLEMREIVAVSAACILPQSIFGVLGYIISGWGVPGLPEYCVGYVYWPIAIPLIVTSLIFAPIGVKMVHKLPHATLRYLFGLLLLVMSSYMLYSVFVEY